MYVQRLPDTQALPLCCIKERVPKWTHNKISTNKHFHVFLMRAHFFTPLDFFCYLAIRFGIVKTLFPFNEAFNFLDSFFADGF